MSLKLKNGSNSVFEHILLNKILKDYILFQIRPTIKKIHIPNPVSNILFHILLNQSSTLGVKYDIITEAPAR